MKSPLAPERMLSNNKFGSVVFPSLDLRNRMVFPNAFVIQQPHPNLNPDLKPISSLSFNTSGMTHKLRAFKQDFSCIGAIQMLFVLYCTIFKVQKNRQVIVKVQHYAELIVSSMYDEMFRDKQLR